MNTYKYSMKNRQHVFKGYELWEALEGGKGKEICCNYIVISEI